MLKFLFIDLWLSGISLPTHIEYTCSYVFLIITGTTSFPNQHIFIKLFHSSFVLLNMAKFNLLFPFLLKLFGLFFSQTGIFHVALAVLELSVDEDFQV